MIAVALAIITGTYARLACFMLAAMFFLWVLVLHAPLVATHLNNGNQWSSLFVAMGMGGASLILAASTQNERHIAKIQSKIYQSRFSGKQSYEGQREQTSMIKLVYCITKKPELSDEEFFRYWKNIHGPIGARIPRLRKLVQSHRINIPEDNHPPAYDGVAELWFDTVEDLLAARQSPEWRASTADEANFVDHSKVPYFVTEEHVILNSN